MRLQPPDSLLERWNLPARCTRRLSRPESPNGVWAVATATGPVVLRHMAGALKIEAIRKTRDLDVDGVVTPELLGVDLDTSSCLEAYVPGVSADAWLPTAPDRVDELATLLGRRLAQLHALSPVPEDAVPLPDALRTRVDRVLAGCAAGGLAATECTVLRELLAVVPDETTRVWCHRDVRLENVLVVLEQPMRLQLVDFEHARPDSRWMDVARLRWEPWPDGRFPRDAFFYGMGVTPTASTLTWAEALFAAGTFAWATRHRDAAREADARRMIADLLADAL